MKSAQKKCCDIAIACHQICGTAKDFCDTQMKMCHTVACNEVKTSKEDKIACKKEAYRVIQQYEALECTNYQNDQCECILKENELEQRKLILNSFKDVYDVNKKMEVDKILEGVKSSKDFANLLTLLVMKYAKSILLILLLVTH